MFTKSFLGTVPRTAGEIGEHNVKCRGCPLSWLSCDIVVIWHYCPLPWFVLCDRWLSFEMVVLWHGLRFDIVVICRCCSLPWLSAALVVISHHLPLPCVLGHGCPLTCLSFSMVIFPWLYFAMVVICHESPLTWSSFDMAAIWHCCHLSWLFFAMLVHCLVFH